MKVTLHRCLLNIGNLEDTDKWEPYYREWLTDGSWTNPKLIAKDYFAGTPGRDLIQVTVSEGNVAFFSGKWEET